MGTRCLTKFYEQDATKPFVVVYRQMDGYPDGHGAELAEFLAARRRINGIGARDTSANAANGIGCLAAQFVAEFKGGEIGGIYLQPEQKPGESGEEYQYEVHDTGSGWLLRVLDVDYDKKRTRLMWEGDPAAFDTDKIAEAEDAS